MEIIDWGALARGALWIGGLSVALAAWSYAFWRSQDGHIPLRQTLAQPGFQIAFNMGLACFALGLAWSGIALWERLAWVILAAAFGWQGGSAIRNVRRSTSHDSATDHGA